MAEIKSLNKQHSLYQEDLANVLSIPGLNELKGKSFLITGASGLIGVCLIDALMLYNRQGAGITIYAVGRSKEKAFSRIGEYYNDSFFHFIEQDVRDSFPEGLSVDYIIPLASNTHPLAYSQYPVETLEINIMGAENALNKAIQCGATVLYPSTVEVYGNARGEDVFTEDYTGILNLNNARSCYPESKRVSEALCHSYASEKGAKVKIVRLSRIFGPTMLPSDSKASSQFIMKAVNKEDIVLKSKGEQYYSYTYVADAVRALLFVLLYGDYAVPYNIASEQCSVHLKDFAGICAKNASTNLVFELPSDVEKKGYSTAMNAIMDTQRLASIGCKSIYSIEDAIHRTIEIIKN
jgi:nucleoside-diphosphate-sugar epimerase